jgi:hypothetical protein
MQVNGVRPEARSDGYGIGSVLVLLFSPLALGIWGMLKANSPGLYRASIAGVVVGSALVVTAGGWCCFDVRRRPNPPSAAPPVADIPVCPEPVVAPNDSVATTLNHALSQLRSPQMRQAHEVLRGQVAVAEPLVRQQLAQLSNQLEQVRAQRNQIRHQAALAGNEARKGIANEGGHYEGRVAERYYRLLVVRDQFSALILILERQIGALERALDPEIPARYQE